MDIRCVVCGEPWDAYGIDHGDMEKWQAELFRQGAGCPCCEGIVDDDKRFHPKTFEDVENGDEDPMLRINAYEDANSKNPPKWIRPEPQVFWTCDGCGVQVVEDQELSTKWKTETAYHLPHNAPGHKWYHSHPYWKNENPDKEPAHKFADGRVVCEFCLNHCDHCGKPISNVLEFSDTYEDGNSFPSTDGHESFCIDCYEQICDQCGCFPEDCNCHDEESEEEDD